MPKRKQALCATLLLFQPFALGGQAGKIPGERASDPDKQSDWPAGVLDDMYARRTYAGSDEIILTVTADGHMVGEKFTTATGKAPLLEASIQAPDEVLRIDVVKDGKYVYTTRPTGRSTTLRWRDADTRPGKSYYYVRVFERDTDNPEGDPEIAWGSPFYVTYK
jgi:hypothetical protein